MPIVAFVATILIFALVGSFVAAGAIIVGAIFLLIIAGYGLYYLYQWQVERAKQAERIREEKEALDRTEKARIELLDRQPTREQFITNFASQIRVAYPAYDILPPILLREFLLIAERLYKEETYELWKAPFELSWLSEALLKSFLAFAQSFPKIQEAQLKAPVAELIDFPRLSKLMIDPFRDGRLFVINKGQGLWRLFLLHCTTASKGHAPVYPQDFNPHHSKAYVADFYLKGTIFHNLFQILVPFGYSDQERFEHQLVSAPSGQGKTTYLCNLIRADLERVAKDEACVIVIDPKGALSELAKYKEFARGGKLDGRLVYIEPSKAHPLALNPFKVARDLTDEVQQNSAVDLLTYTLGSIFETDPTVLQSGVIRYIIRLMFELSNPTLHSMVDFLTEKNYLKEVYQSAIRKMNEPYKSFLQNQIPDLAPITKQGILNRLSILVERPEIERMFCASECRFDMFQETLSAKVIIVDANVGALTQEPMEIFGRLFLAMLLHAARRRITHKGKKLPVFVYVDEAQQFVSRDIRTRTILNEVRAQKIAMTFCPQSMSDIALPEVRAALERSNIRARTRKGSVVVDVGHEEATWRYTLHVDDFRYHHDPDAHPNSCAPHMSEAEFEVIQDQMRVAYCASPPPIPKEFVESYDRP